MASNGESKRTGWWTSPLLAGRRGEPTVAAAEGGGEGSLLSTMVLLRGDVEKSRYVNPKVQTDASFLIKVDFN